MKSNQSKRGNRPELGISIKVPASTYAVLRKMAERNLRSISAQIQFLANEAQKGDKQ